jgi:hypothetical protein
MSKPGAAGNSKHVLLMLPQKLETGGLEVVKAEV